MKRRLSMIPVLLLFLRLNISTEARQLKNELTHIYWISQDRETIISINRCGQALCGRIVGLRSNHNPNGSPLLDQRNEYGYLRSRSICGMTIFRNLRWSPKSGSWEGYFYDPYTGLRPSMNLWIGNDGNLMIRKGEERRPFFSLTSAVLSGTWRSYRGPVKEDCSIS